MRLDTLRARSLRLFLLFFFLQAQVKAQSVHYTVYKKSVCSNHPSQVKRFSLSNSDTTFRSDESGVCYVTRLGSYFLLSSEIDTGVEPPKVELTAFGNMQDTVQNWAMYPILIQGYGDDLEPGDWVYCDNRCDGVKIDYYKNGQKRVEGKFKKGKPVSYVRFYDTTGKVVNVEQFDKDGKKVRSVRLNN
jgi:hypothetical protein